MIYPKCHPIWYVNGEYVENKFYMGPAYTGKGYMLPCCWCDRDDPELVNEFEELGFFNDHLKVSNTNSIDDIINSNEWYQFHKNLLESPSDSPTVCKRKCSYYDNLPHLKIIK